MHLLIEFFDSFDRRRNAEYLLALHENTGNAEIKKIHLFVDPDTALNFSSKKFVVNERKDRPTYKDLLEYCNDYLDGEICAIANSDIIFNNTLQNAKRIDLENTFLAISRWEITFNGRSFEYQLFDNAASQDSWIFRPPMPVTEEMNFLMGTPGCDNRIARLIRDAGYEVKNPANRVITAHFHLTHDRNYGVDDRVPGPYLLVPPIDTLDGEQPCIEADGFDEQGNPYLNEPAMTTTGETLQTGARDAPPGRRPIQWAEPQSDGHSAPRRILFDQLPGCAADTIDEYLRRHFPCSTVFTVGAEDPIRSIEFFQSLPIHTRHRFRLITGPEASSLLQSVHPDPLDVTVLRDPIERVLIQYEDVDHAQITLEDFVKSELGTNCRNWYTTHFTGLTLEDAEADPDAAIERALQAVSETYDVIGFLDDLPSFIQQLNSASGLSFKSSENVQINSEHGTEIQIDEKAKHLIADVNVLDIELFEVLHR